MIYGSERISNWLSPTPLKRVHKLFFASFVHYTVSPDPCYFKGQVLHEVVSSVFLVFIFRLIYGGMEYKLFVQH